MKIPMVFKKFTALFTICFAFLLMLPCAGFAEDNRVEAKKNPNATHFPVTGSGKTSRELFKEGVYRLFADDSMITYLVVMHKKGDLAGDPFERTYIGIESVQRNHPGGKPDGSVFMAARLRSPREVKRYLGMKDNPPVRGCLRTSRRCISCFPPVKDASTSSVVRIICRRLSWGTTFR